ncbi:hypothetical protein U0021_09020 [Moraxella canis]|uniref:Pre-toxin TG domain-containing protein n=1 Tax=Moraxella canis TaxID=90239 RepID=A0ABZ0WXW4_9GAMM|nr:hypothetical protein U0021_09020 [Moraxella canis]
MVGDWLVTGELRQRFESGEIKPGSDDYNKVLNTARLTAGAIALLYDFDVDTAVGSAEEAVENNGLKAVISSLKIANKLRSIYRRNNRLTWADVQQAVKEEGINIAGNILTLADGQLTFDDAKIFLDLLAGTEFNTTNKGEAARKIEQIARRYQPFKNYKSQLVVGDRINLASFTKRSSNSGARADYIDPNTQWKISPDRGNSPHGGSAWKLIDSKGRRVGTISKDGIFLRD